MNQIPNIEDEKTGIEELDNLANIYGWHHEKCAGHSHFPSCPVVKLRRVLIKEQQTLHHQLQKAREELLEEMEAFTFEACPYEGTMMRAFIRSKHSELARQPDQSLNQERE